MLPGEELPSHAAIFVQLLRRHDILVGRNLEHGIGGGVDDQVPGADVLVAVDVDDLGAAPGRIGQHTPAGGRPEGSQHLLGKALGVGGQGLLGDDARNFPVADGGVLAHGPLPEPGHGAGGAVGLRQVVHTVHIAQPRPDQMGNLQNPRVPAGPEGVDAYVAEGRAVGGLTDTAGIQNNQKDPFQRRSLLSVSPWPPPRPAPPASFW